MYRSNRGYHHFRPIEQVETRLLFAAPVVDAIGNYRVPVGKTIQIPITATSSDALTYNVRNSSANVIAKVHSGDTFVQMDVAGFSQPLVFELFNDVAPEAVRRFTGLVNAGAFNGSTFDHVVNNFVIQGGRIPGTTAGEPDYIFDDEFNPNTIFTGTGQLAVATQGKDVNKGQFFVTEGPQRLLDFNYTIFGQLVRGEATRQAISNVATDSNDLPTNPVNITHARVILDTVDRVLEVKVNAKGSFNVKVTGTGTNGSNSQSFTVTGVTDSINDPPILGVLPPVFYTVPNTPVAIQLSATDIEGDHPFFVVNRFSDVGINATASGINSTTGLVTVVPQAGFVGTFKIIVGVLNSASDTTRGNITGPVGSTPFGGIADTQVITISVGGSPIRLTTVPFNATAAAPTKNVIVASFRSGVLNATASNFTAKIDWGDGSVTDGVVTKNRRGVYYVMGTKNYGSAAAGALPITVTVTGPNGAQARGTTTATLRSFASLANGILSVFGTSVGDKIGIGRKGAFYAVTVNGLTRAFAISSVTSIQVSTFEGNDSISEMLTGVIGTYMDGGAGNDVLSGSDGNDTLSGGDGRDTIYCNGGNDRAAGGTGNDTISGGVGKDRLFGGDGNDSITGDGSPDIIGGDGGDDTLIGGVSNDSIYGGTGNDIINGLSGADFLDGGAGSDTTKLDLLDILVDIEVKV